MDVKKADFSFLGFKVVDITMKVGDGMISDNLGLNISCDGELDSDKKVFILGMLVHVEDAEKTINLDVKAEGYFEYNCEDFNQLLGFIGINSPALLFPYVRSYIATLTTNAGIKPVTLPTLNLSKIGKSLADDLKKELEKN